MSGAGAEVSADIAQRLRDAREFEQMTTQNVAEQAGLAESDLAAIENATRAVSGPELRRFAELYHRSIAYFLGTDTAFARPRGPASERGHGEG